MQITFHGHSCVQLQSETSSVIIDPFITGNPVAKVKADDIKVDYILLTHGHNDHVGDAEQMSKNNEATIIAPFELATYMGWQGCNVHPMHIGGGHAFDFGHVKLTQAFHGSGLTQEDKQEIIYMGMPSGMLVTMNGKTIYHAGDTALFGDMKMIGERHSIDLAFLPIGDNFTMGPEDALLAAEWLQARQVVPIHYNTFPLIKQDAQMFGDTLKSKGIECIVLQPGQSFSL